MLLTYRVSIPQAKPANAYWIYRASQLKIIKSIILRIAYQEFERKIYYLLRILQFIIQKRTVQRKVALSVFQAGWELFANKGYEGLLIPFGRTLTWLDRRDGDEIGSFRPMNLNPTWLRDLLLDQGDIPRDHQFTLPRHLSESHDIAVAIIRPEENVKWNVPMEQLRPLRQDILDRHGIVFGKRLIMIKLVHRNRDFVYTTPNMLISPDSRRILMDSYAHPSSTKPNTMIRTSILVHDLNMINYQNSLADPDLRRFQK